MKSPTKFQDLSVIQKIYDLIRWYIPLLQRLPKQHKFGLGERLINRLYDCLEELIAAKYQTNKRDTLQSAQSSLNIIRYQSRLLFDFDLVSSQRYKYINQILDDIGNELGAWLKSIH